MILTFSYSFFHVSFIRIKSSSKEVYLSQLVEIKNVRRKLDKMIMISSKEKHKQMNEILSNIENEPLITTNRKVIWADIVSQNNKSNQIKGGNTKTMIS